MGLKRKSPPKQRKLGWGTRRATRLQVSDVGLLLLAQALEKSGRAKEAEAARQQARLVTPDFAAAQRTVDQALGR
jgi:hypothetical protein